MPEDQPQEAKKSFQPPIPAAVARGAAQASELQEQFIKAQNEPEGEPAAQPEPEPQPPEVVEPQPVEIPEEQFQPAPAEPVEPAPAEGTVEYWKRRYNAMKGRYDKSLSTVQALSSELTNKNNVLATLESRITQPAPAQPAQQLVSQEEIEEYGPEFSDFANRLIQQATQPLLQEIEGLRGQISGVQASTQRNARQNLVDAMDKEIPDWRKQNRDPEFLAWLSLPDAYSGSIRQEMLNAALARNDTPRVLAFFNGFLSEQAVTAPAEPVERANGQTKTMPKVPLATFAAPGRAKPAATAAPPRPAEKPIITAAQIAKFYADRTRGLYRGREAESQQMEAEIFAAQAEGRIR